VAIVGAGGSHGSLAGLKEGVRQDHLDHLVFIHPGQQLPTPHYLSYAGP
jgi:hypothetical protein